MRYIDRLIEYVVPKFLYLSDNWWYMFGLLYALFVLWVYVVWPGLGPPCYEYFDENSCNIACHIYKELMMQYMYIVLQFGLGAFNMYYAEHLEDKVGIPVWIVACAP